MSKEGEVRKGKLGKVGGGRDGNRRKLEREGRRV